MTYYVNYDERMSDRAKLHNVHTGVKNSGSIPRNACVACET